MSITIKSNNRWRNLLYGYELPKKWRNEFDWMKSDEEYENALFVKVPGKQWYYSVNDFNRISDRMSYAEFKGWDGYMNDTYFSGVVIKLSSDGEQYKIGRFYSYGEHIGVAYGKTR